MFDLIKTTYKVGDKIKLVCVNGEFSGEILAISAEAIMIKTFEGRNCGIRGCDISFFADVEPKAERSVESPEHSDSLIIDTKQSAPNLTAQEVASNQEEIHLTEQNIITEEDAENVSDNEHAVSPASSESLFEITKPQIKVVGHIDLDSINQGTRPKKSNTPKTQTKTKQTFNSFDALGVLVDDEHKAQNEQFVPALGEVYFVKPEFNYGFIRDGKTGERLHFKMYQIVDENISQSITSATNSHVRIPVLYSIIDNNKGGSASAITIHRADKVIALIQLAQSLAANGESKHAIRVLEHILNEYSENFSAQELKENIEKSQRKGFTSKTKYLTQSKYYKEAKGAQEEGDYEHAIKLYKKAIEQGENLESAIKDLGSLYTNLFKNEQNATAKNTYRDEAIAFMQKYVHLLQKGLSKWMYLESFYYAIRDFDNFFNAIDNILSNTQVTTNKERYILYLNKKAAGFIRAERFEEAKQILEKSLSISPQNHSALKLLEIADSENNESDIKELESVIKALEFESINSGISSFITQTLDEYDEYVGVKEATKDSSKYTKKTLSDIRALIATTFEDKKFAGRPKERAQHLLTEAKLMLQLEPDNTFGLRSVMARYCNDMAKINIYNNSSLDIIRFFYNEAFALAEKYSSNVRQVSYYLLTTVYGNEQLSQSINRIISVDNALKIVLSGDFDQKKWDTILTMFLYNTQIFYQILNKLYSTSEYYSQSMLALKNFGVDDINLNSKYNQDQYVQIWSVVRDNRIREYKEVIASISSISDASSLDELIITLEDILGIRKNWTTPLDNRRFLTLTNNILDALRSYIKSYGYRNKETNHNNAIHQILQLKEEIKAGPTKLSFDAILPLLDKMTYLLNASFHDIQVMSEPKISISLLSDSTVINNDNTVSIQVSVSNHPESSPVSDVSIDIEKSNSIISVYKSDILYNMIDGGESTIFKLKFKVSDSVINQKATAATIYCNYKSRGVTKMASAQLSLKLYSQDEFEPIENPYSPIADGGPVPLESNMFYGRETEIGNIVDAIIKSPSKQIIIYGQKRSGKSSVMLHLKQSLLNTGKTFCVFFSLGDIINNLNEASFYYKIISSIKQELEILDLEGKSDVPQFDIPSAKDFKYEDEDNPLNTFSKYMIKFKLACKQTSGWEDKNLVVMIDEFTYLYTEIKKGNVSPSIMKQWKAITQNERAQFSVVLVGQDVVPSFKKEDYARNAFGVIQDMRLTYLKEEPARALIETPILDEDGHSRYIGDAVTRIIEYTSRNPYYIQIFCSRLVDYMNDNKSIRVTEADVNEVARSFIIGSEALEEDKFDNLIRAGESEDLQEYSEADILAVLRQIALNSKNIGYCNRADIDALDDKEKEDAIIKDLYDREVLDLKGEDNYKIQVKLFQEWLLNH